MPRRWFTLLAWGAVSLGGGSARADNRCAGKHPWVLVQLRADKWTQDDKQRVLVDLHHTLAAQGIDACLDDAHPPGAQLATLAIELPSDDRATVDIEISDAVTHKRVRRDVDLAPIPRDGRELAIAIEADELLRASWAELALETERARQAHPPVEVIRSVADVLRPRQISDGGALATLGARAAAEHFLGGATLMGADVYGRKQLSSRMDLEIAVGARAGPSSMAAVNGRVRAVAAGAGVDGLFRLGSTRSGWLAVGAGLSANWLEFRVEPAPDATGAAYANLLLVAGVRLVGRFALGNLLHATAALAGGETLRGVQATDAGEVVARATGIALGASVGLETP